MTPEELRKAMTFWETIEETRLEVQCDDAAEAAIKWLQETYGFENGTHDGFLECLIDDLAMFVAQGKPDLLYTGPIVRQSPLEGGV